MRLFLAKQSGAEGGEEGGKAEETGRRAEGRGKDGLGGEVTKLLSIWKKSEKYLPL